jgi:hypothetical protein
MKTYIVTFEIKDLVRKSRVKEKLKEFGYYCPIHDNAWAIRTDLSATEIRNVVTALTEKSDRVFIMRTGTIAAWSNTYGTEHSEWLKKYL